MKRWMKKEKQIMKEIKQWWRCIRNRMDGQNKEEMDGRKTKMNE